MKTQPRYSGTKMGRALRQQGRRFDWFASEMGVSAATITRWTNGSRRMDRDSAERAARILGIPFVFLFESPESNKNNLTGSKDAAA